MNYLNPIANADGGYSNMQSTPAEGLVAFPDEFLSEFYKEGKEYAGFVDITHDGKTVLTCVWNEENYLAYIESLPRPIEPTQAEKREEAYNTLGIIEWDGKMITVTEAAQLWNYYAAEGNENAAELTALISEAKAKIREMYPDEVTV